MKFEVGDKVVVKHSNDDGVVREIINDKMVLVEVRGVKFPVYNDQLNYPYFKMFSQQTREKKSPAKKYIDDIKKEKKTPKYKVAEGVWVLFFPVFSKDVFDDDVVDSLRVYLVNQTESGVRFHFWLRLKGETEMELQNEIPALADFYLMNIDFEQLNDNPSFDFEFSLLNPDKSRAEYYEVGYKPKARQVFKQIEHLTKQGDAFFSYQLFKEYPVKQKVEEIIPESSWGLDRLAAAGFKVVNNKRLHTGTPPPSVLDLHIEKITDNYSNMSAGEKLAFQLNAFEKYMDQAELHYLQHVFIIHGIGKGKLKEEIHELLKHRVSVKSFVQQHHPWYGNGATEVFLK